MRDARCEMRDAKCEMRDARCEMRDTKCEIRLKDTRVFIHITVLLFESLKRVVD